MAFGQLHAPISVVRLTSYAESSGRILTDPTGERRNRQFRQRFRGLRSCQPNPSGESGVDRYARFVVDPGLWLLSDLTRHRVRGNRECRAWGGVVATVRTVQTVTARATRSRAIKSCAVPGPVA